VPILGTVRNRRPTGPGHNQSDLDSLNPARMGGFYCCNRVELPLKPPWEEGGV